MEDGVLRPGAILPACTSPAALPVPSSLPEAEPGRSRHGEPAQSDAIDAVRAGLLPDSPVPMPQLPPQPTVSALRPRRR